MSTGSPSLEDRIRRLEDRDAIHQLFVDYGHFLDSGDLDAYAALFAEDGEVMLGPLGRAHDALTTFLGQAALYEAAARPGLQLVLSNEPVADLNMLVVGAGADHDHFRELVSSCLRRNLPFLLMVFPEAGEAFNELAANLGLVYAAELPDHGT